MIFNYTVKHNGVYYPAGTEVPVGGTPKVEPVKNEPKAEETPKPKAEPKKKASKR